ncbi:permease of the major facilitator superfamily [Macrophomina phaseolina]|uniref:Permease of the major facilitator superfamily n=1 Tax=Macrophomina phaseolina TaxID=35725 RepID=A0ABQ8G369_9PEZI|nr:permease of the major facilitator superfamily [Macrophomina phaseolina]
MHNRQAISLPMLWRSLKDYNLWPVYVISMLFKIPSAPPKAYLNNTGGIPITVYAALNMLLITWLTERVGQIAVLGLLAQVWILPLLIIENTSAGTISHWGQYAVLLFLLGQPAVHAAQVGWCSRPSNAVRTRAVSAALYSITVQPSGTASSNIYRLDDKPLYRRGNRELFAITVGTIAAYAFAKTYYVWRNKTKRTKWNAMTKEQQQHYLANTTDQGNKRLDFVFQSLTQRSLIAGFSASVSLSGGTSP